MEDNKNLNMKVLIASPVYQKPQILQLFLESLTTLNKANVHFDYLFYDDNSDQESSKLLHAFKPEGSRVDIIDGSKEEAYLCDQRSHYWKEDLIWKVAGYKNDMIQQAINKQYDYLFLIDSDLLIYPHTIDDLMSAKKDVISNIFWTKWQPDQPKLPNVWLSGVYGLIDKKREETLSNEESLKRYRAFIQKLATPGIYEVGGLGACTLISRKALLSGVSFQEIENLSYWGEDRHFCVRAKALGLKLFVDTRNPAYHIYRESDIEGARVFLEQLNSKKKCTFTRYYKENKNKVVLSMIIKNEASRYLKQVLMHAKKYIDEAVIIDDGSEDNSVALCHEILEGIPVHIIKNSESKFNNEINLRKQQWDETIKVNPDWILSLDADEIFEEAIVHQIKQLINQKAIDVYYFRLYDFWNEDHYRDDQYWRAHKSYRPFLIRYQKDFPYKWLEQPQHCGRLPYNIHVLPSAKSQLRLKHYGWAKYEDRLFKYNRYMALDPDAKYGWKEQYESILDDEPKLTKWKEM
nr:glycosyltransferase [Vallitalea pronyensis]